MDLTNPDPNEKDESVVYVSLKDDADVADVDKVQAAKTVALISPRWHRRHEGATGSVHRHNDAGSFDVKRFFFHSAIGSGALPSMAQALM